MNEKDRKLFNELSKRLDIEIRPYVDKEGTLKMIEVQKGDYKAVVYFDQYNLDYLRSINPSLIEHAVLDLIHKLVSDIFNDVVRSIK